ncbi:MAG: hypothetical protein EHM41_12805, partial [Chloroflexi bacterium]
MYLNQTRRLNMEFFLNLVIESAKQVLLTLQHNWPFLVVSIVIAALLKLFLDADRVSNFMNRYRGAGVLAATTAAVGTPLCSCGTTAVILGMMASTMPWAPIIAFMVSSPLTSPGELVYSAGLFGWPFALAFFLASIGLGLAGGSIGGVLDNRGWLKNQTRFTDPAAASCGCTPKNQIQESISRVYSHDISNLVLAAEPAGCGCSIPAASTCGCGTPSESRLDESTDLLTHKPVKPKVSIVMLLNEMFTSGKRLLVMFVGFAFVGYFLNGLIPQSWVTQIFGSGNIYSVPLAATLGLPFYINSEASLPLVRALMESGMSEGAALAFLISGSGTSIGAIAGALTIARWRVVGLVVG